MNKAGHLAFGVALGSAYLYHFNPPKSLLDLGELGIILGVTAISSLAPDIDHKTSTASKVITPFSAQTRHKLRMGAVFFALIGVILMLARFHVVSLPVPDKVVQGAPLWIAASILCLALAKMRDIILFGVGAAILYAFYLYHLGWFFAFLGLAIFIIPLVSHRGIIHTPEFALCLSVGALSLFAHSAWYLYGAGLGFVLGWWAHLLGDLFGSEGIHSLFLPRLKVALHLFSNGGWAEKMITRFSWVASFALWALMCFPTLAENVHHVI
jgi:hypothetical protein